MYQVDKIFIFSAPRINASSSSKLSNLRRILRHRDSKFKRPLSKRVREEEKIPDDDEARGRSINILLRIRHTSLISFLLESSEYSLLGFLQFLFEKEIYYTSVERIERVSKVSSIHKEKLRFHELYSRNANNDTSFIIFIATMFRCQKIALSLFLYR